MRRTWCLCFSVAVTTTVLTTGCTSPTLSGPRSAAQALSGYKPFSAGSPGSSGIGAGSESPPTDPYGSMPAQPPATVASTGGVALASLMQAGKSVTNALKIQPKVTPALDPVALDNSPANQLKAAADIHYKAGYFRETQNDLAAAAKHYRSVLDAIPNDFRALAGYGRVQDQLGNTVEAEQYLRRACEIAPREPGPWSDLAQSHMRRNNLSDAITCQQQAVSLQPNNPLYRGALARLFVDAGRNDEAVQQLAAVHGEATANFQVGCLLEERQMSDQARQHVQRSLALNPGLAPARQMLNRWQIAAANLPAEQGPIYRTTRLPTP